MIAPWLKAHLEATGAWNADGVGRRARSRHCADCGAITLVGLDGDMCAGVVHVDPEPISPIGEVLATISGRTTVRVWRAGSRIELTGRSPIHIAGSPAGTVDVLAEHACHSPLPAAPWTHPPPVIATFATDALPPF